MTQILSKNIETFLSSDDVEMKNLGALLLQEELSGQNDLVYEEELLSSILNKYVKYPYQIRYYPDLETGRKCIEIFRARMGGYSGYSGMSGYTGYSGPTGFSGYSGATITGFSGYYGSVVSTISKPKKRTIWQKIGLKSSSTVET